MEINCFVFTKHVVNDFYFVFKLKKFNCKWYGLPSSFLIYINTCFLSFHYELKENAGIGFMNNFDAKQNKSKVLVLFTHNHHNVLSCMDVCHQYWRFVLMKRKPNNRSFCKCSFILCKCYCFVSINSMCFLYWKEEIVHKSFTLTFFMMRKVL